MLVGDVEVRDGRVVPVGRNIVKDSAEIERLKRRLAEIDDEISNLLVGYQFPEEGKKKRALEEEKKKVKGQLKMLGSDEKTCDEIYKGFMLYKSGKSPAKFTARKDRDEIVGSLEDVKGKIDKYWDKKDAEELAKKTTDYRSTKVGMWEVVIMDPTHLKMKLEGTQNWTTPLHFNQVDDKIIAELKKEGLVDKNFFVVDASSDRTFDFRNIEKDTKENKNFRKVLFTADRMQLVVMSLQPDEEIGEEVHSVDQFFRIEEGKGKAIVDGREILIEDGASLLVKAGRVHNIINNSKAPLKLYTLYSPPHHQDGLVQENRPS